MRTGSLALVALLALGSRPGWASDPADPCSFITRRNRERCLGKLLVPTRSADDAVALDGVVIGKGPLLLRDLVPGRHVVEVTPPDGGSRRHTLTVRRGRAHVLHTGAAASLTRAGAPPLSEAFFGYHDECDGVFLRNATARIYPVDPDRLAALRGDRALASHLPTVAAALARAERSCDAGEALACRRAGEQASQGAGGRASNATRAAGFFRRGCDLHDDASCTELADQLASGWGVERDEAAAAALHERICARGDAASCRKLGVTLAFTTPSPQSRERALSLLQKACEGGDQQGCSLAPQVQRQVACDREPGPHCADPR